MKTMDQLHESAIRLCAEHDVTVHSYGRAWWLIGNGINRVVAELAGLCRSDLAPMFVAKR